MFDMHPAEVFLVRNYKSVYRNWEMETLQRLTRTSDPIRKRRFPP